MHFGVPAATAASEKETNNITTSKMEIKMTLCYARVLLPAAAAADGVSRDDDVKYLKFLFVV